MSTVYNNKWHKSNSFRIKPNSTAKLLIQVESGQFEAPQQYHRQYIEINGTEVVNSDAPRQYRLTQLRHNGNWQLIANNGYDVYGSAEQAVAAADFLSTFQLGDMLILNTWDEPLNNSSYLYSALTSDFYQKISNFTRDFRDMHLLIAIKGKGLVYEEYGYRYSNSISFSGWLL